jgi:hypothetical protein
MTSHHDSSIEGRTSRLDSMTEDDEESKQISQKSKVFNIRTGYDENPAVNLDEEGNERQDVLR